MPRLRSILAAVAAAVAGCSGGDRTPPAIEAAPTPEAPLPPSVPTAAVAVVAPLVPFRLPDDAGGRAVAAVTALVPPAAAPLPMTTAPRPRVSDLDRGEVPLPPLKPAVRALPVPPAKPVLPTPPAERLPADFGVGSAESPAAIKLPKR